MNALQALTDLDREAVIEWLRDCATDARHDEPSVGIFGNERMGAAFEELAEIVAALNSDAPLSIAVDDVRERVRTAIARELDRDTLSPFERLNNAADAAIKAMEGDK